ncbi:MAG: gliding motility-associated ABC transporter ATP-binding subunit GldA [Flavobacteriales bacterium]|nr:gliding motility-associated ABC transporter ATP-binding subunit GldA [Flavobacteriales bacterium]
MSIEVEKLSKKYDDQWAVNELSFTVPTGQVVGFLGPNGAGKSTTMKMLTCFITPTSGSARINGFDIENQSMEIRNNIGYLPEHNPLYHEMYVKEYLSFVADMCGVKKDKKMRVEKMVETTGLTREQNKKISSLSKGYKQRVGMAQALMKDPKVLILDEPTSGLDPNQIVEIRKLIKTLGEDRTVLLSTHIMQEVEAMCSRVIIIDKGKLVADDALSNLQHKHGDKKVVVVQFKNEVDLGQLQRMDGVLKVQKINENTFEVTSKTEVALHEKLFNFAVKTNNVILEQKEKSQNLEHIFRSITKN